jgi:hypothetical protein
MNKRISNLYAPHGTCKNCGFAGQDWGFKYHPNYCTKCYEKWKIRRREENRVNHTNENVKITDDLIVTENVKKRLQKKANSDIAFSKKYRIANTMIYIAYAIFFFPLIYAIISGNPISGMIWLICAVIAVTIGLIFSKISNIEVKKRQKLVKKRFVELAKRRKNEIEEAKRFYASPEWRLLRKQIIDSHKDICRICGKKITEKNDITIDHILPRSKFPKDALEINNMQILCRSCNSSKGNRIIDTIDT